MRMRRRAFLVLVLLAAPLLSSVAQVAPPAAPPPPVAPDWVKPGARITYWTGTISLEGTRETIYVLDPQGDIYDDVGNRYRIEDDRSKGGGFGRNVGGHGFLQMDIVAVTDREVCLVLRAYVMTDVDSPPVLSMISASRVDRATGGGLWGHPAVFRKMRSTRDQKVLRGPYRLGGRTYDSVVLSTGRLARVHDSESGLMIVERLTGQSQRGWVWQNGFFYPAPPRSSGCLTLFRGFRQMRVPWSGHRLPEAARKVNRLIYQGGTTVSMPGSGEMTIPATMTLARQAAGDTWVQYEQIFYQPPFRIQPEQRTVTPQISGTGTVGGWWLPPADLAKLKAGTEIDRDPSIGSTTMVQSAGVVPDGRYLVTIRETAARYTAQWTYDRALGVLAQYQLIHPTPLATTTYSFSLQKME